MSYSFTFNKLFKCTRRKRGPLSDTIVLGNPWVGKVINSKLCILTDAVSELLICMSIHLECVYTIINDILLLIGPA